MLCNNCGKPVEDGQLLCPECQAAQQPAAPQEEAPVEQNVPAQENAPTKKSKRGLIVALAVIAVLAVAAIVLALNWNSWFKPAEEAPRDYLLRVEENSLRESFRSEPVADVAQPIDGKHASSTISVELGENMMTVLQAAMDQSGTPVDMSWLKDVLLQVDTNITENVALVDVGFGINASKCITLRFITDELNQMCYIGLPELSDTYLSADLEYLGLNVEDFKSAFRSYNVDQQLLAKLESKMPDSDAMAQMANRYLTAAYSQVDTVERSTETVTLDGISQEMTVLAMTVNEEQFRDIVVAVLEAAQNDEQLKQILDAYLEYCSDVYREYYGQYAVYESIEMMTAEEILAEIPGVIEEMMAEEITSTETVTYRVYVDQQDKVCGRSLLLPEDAGIMSYVVVENGENFAAEILIKAEEEIKIAGGGTKEKSSYSLTADEKEVLTLEVENLDEEALRSGELLGSFKIGLGKDLWKEMKESLGEAAGPVAILAAPAIQLNYSGNAIEYGLYLGGMMLVNIKAETKENEAADIVFPTDTLDAETTTEEQILEWFAEMDFRPVLQNIADAGLPQELLDMLGWTLGSAQAQIAAE